MPTPVRAVLLAAWGTAYLQDAVPMDAAVTAIERDDEPHLVVADPLHGPDELPDALVDLRGRGVAGLRAALPAPGDLVGLLGPPPVNQAALAAGEAVVAVPGAGVATPSVPALVPDVTVFGTADDHGHCVTWREMPASPGMPDVPTVAQADRDLRAAMRESTQTLAAVSTGPWSSDGHQAAGRLRGAGRGLVLPEAAGPRATSLAQRAVQVLAIVAAARSDDGGALTSFAAQSRHSALVPLERAGRRALVAAAGACLETASSPPGR